MAARWAELTRRVVGVPPAAAVSTVGFFADDLDAGLFLADDLDAGLFFADDLLAGLFFAGLFFADDLDAGLFFAVPLASPGNAAVAVLPGAGPFVLAADGVRVWFVERAIVGV